MKVRLAFLVTVTFSSLLGQDDLPTCKPGKYLEANGRCKSCTDGVDFTPGDNRDTSCVPCTPKCEKYEIISHCNVSHDIVCGCHAGSLSVPSGDCIRITDGVAHHPQIQLPLNISDNLIALMSVLEDVKNELLLRRSNLTVEIQNQQQPQASGNETPDANYTEIILLIANTVGIAILILALIATLVVRLRKSENGDARASLQHQVERSGARRSVRAFRCLQRSSRRPYNETQREALPLSALSGQDSQTPREEGPAAASVLSSQQGVEGNTTSAISSNESPTLSVMSNTTTTSIPQGAGLLPTTTASLAVATSTMQEGRLSNAAGIKQASGTTSAALTATAENNFATVFKQDNDILYALQQNTWKAQTRLISQSQCSTPNDLSLNESIYESITDLKEREKLPLMLTNHDRECLKV